MGRRHKTARGGNDEHKHMMEHNPPGIVISKNKDVVEETGSNKVNDYKNLEADRPDGGIVYGGKARRKRRQRRRKTIKKVKTY